MVATPIGNLEDVSLRALRTLKEVQLIAAEDTRVTRKLLSRYDIHTRLIAYHQYSKRYQANRILRALDLGDVALVSDAGAPLLSDPGSDLVRTAIDLGIDVVAIPGPSAITNALMISGLAPEPFLFLGFLSPNRKERMRTLTEAAGLRATLVLFEAPHRIRQTLTELAEALGDRKVAVCRELTKLHEQVIRTTLGEAAAQVPERGEFTLVVEGAPEPLVAEANAVSDKLRELLQEGVSRKDAIERVAAELELPRRQVYRLALQLER